MQLLTVGLQFALRRAGGADCQRAERQRASSVPSGHVPLRTGRVGRMYSLLRSVMAVA